MKYMSFTDWSRTRKAVKSVERWSRHQELDHKDHQNGTGPGYVYKGGQFIERLRLKSGKYSKNKFYCHVCIFECVGNLKKVEKFLYEYWVRDEVMDQKDW